MAYVVPIFKLLEKVFLSSYTSISACTYGLEKCKSYILTKSKLVLAENSVSIIDRNVSIISRHCLPTVSQIQIVL